MSVPTTLLIFLGYCIGMSVVIIIIASAILSFIASFFNSDKELK